MQSENRIVAVALLAVISAGCLGFSLGRMSSSDEEQCCCCDCCDLPPAVFYDYPPSVIIEHGPHDWPEPPCDLLDELPELPPPAKCKPKCEDEKPKPKSCAENGCFPRIDRGCRPSCRP